MPVRVAINGFGRIGRCAFKIAFDNPEIEIIAINDLSNARVLAHLLKYDTAYGTYEKTVEVEEDGKIAEKEGFSVMEAHFGGTDAKEHFIVVDGKKTKIIAEPDPEKLP